MPKGLGMSTTKVSTPFRVVVAEDHLTATIRLRDEADFKHVTTSDVVVALEQARIMVDDAVTSRIQEYIARITAGRHAYEPVLIAKGRPLDEGKDATFEWYEPIAPREEAINEDEDERRLSHYDVSKFVMVNAGDTIGHITPAVPATPGIDVHGNEIPIRKAPSEIELNENVVLAEDGTTVVAQEAGRVNVADGRITVVTVLEITENVDFSVGHINSPTPVNVRGNIQDLFQVRTDRWLTVGGAIEAAEVDAAEHIEVRGGILNRDKGFVRSGGTIAAKFCAEAQVDAEGDITIGKEVLNSRVNTESRLLIPNGAVIGGKVYARVAIEAKVVGSDAGVPTDVAVGVREDLLREAKVAEIENARRRKAIERIRETVSPLMAQAKHLAQHQRERATELMFQADSIEAEINKVEQRVKDGMAAVYVPSGEHETAEDFGPYVLVSSKVCQGVTVRIDDRVTSFVKEMKGPIRIHKRKIKNHTVVAAVNQLTGSVTELNSRKVEFEEETAE